MDHYQRTYHWFTTSMDAHTAEASCRASEPPATQWCPENGAPRGRRASEQSRGVRPWRYAPRTPPQAPRPLSGLTPTPSPRRGGRSAVGEGLRPTAGLRKGDGHRATHRHGRAAARFLETARGPTVWGTGTDSVSRPAAAGARVAAGRRSRFKGSFSGAGRKRWAHCADRAQRGSGAVSGGSVASRPNLSHTPRCAPSAG